MTSASEVFKQKPAEKEQELKDRVLWLRKTSFKYSSWPISELQKFCIEWQEVTGRLLEAGNRPGSKEKLKDAEKKRRQLKEIVKRGITKK